MRQLEELNLVDNFLVNSLTSHQVYGEPAARCILECILGRKLGKLQEMLINQHFLRTSGGCARICIGILPLRSANPARETL